MLGCSYPYPIRVQEVNEAKRSSVAWPTGFLAVIPKSEFFQYEVYFQLYSFRVYDHYLMSHFVSIQTTWRAEPLDKFTIAQHLSFLQCWYFASVCQSNPSPTSRIFISHLHTPYSWYNDSITSIFHHRCFDITFGVRALLQHRVPRGHGDFCEDLLHFTSAKRRSLELLIFTTS